MATKRKSILVSEETHRLLMEQSKKVRASSMDELLRHYVEENVIRIPVPQVVQSRWKSVADAAGYSVEQWVVQRVEAAIQYNADPGVIGRALGKLFNK